MNRNTSTRFSQIPNTVTVGRSKFNRDHGVTTSFNFGDLIPFEVDEVLPGDTFDLSTAITARLSSSIHPTMSNAYIDYYYFFIPRRLVWSHWANMFGENDDGPWTTSQVEYEVPSLPIPVNGFTEGGVADRFGIPINATSAQLGEHIDACFHRAYRLVWNEWFRNENTTAPLLVNLGDTETDDTIDNIQKACKFPDYFTSCLPEPQRGPSVLLPLGQQAVVRTADADLVTGLTHPALRMSAFNNTTNTYPYFVGGINGPNLDKVGVILSNKSGSTAPVGVSADPDYSFAGTFPKNLYADLSTATAATVNQLRQAFAIQRFYERSARSGTRYTEYLRSAYGVISPDARLQRPEYLGGGRFSLSMSQVVQNSSTNDVTPQGNVSGLSKTTESGHSFTKSFTEHGILLGVMVARYDHVYQQGLNRMFSRKGRFDFYDPCFANLGEQAVKNKEIYAYGMKPDDVFGYQEAWAEYRYKPSIVTGSMRSEATKTLDSWHYADKYITTPTLSSTWIVEDAANVDRTLAVTSAKADQLIADIWITEVCARTMPLYSVPGLIDHH